MTEPVPEVLEAEKLRRQAEAAIEAYDLFLASPAFQHAIDLAVLVKIAGDDTVDVRERRRAAEVLANLRMQAMAGRADLLAAREQVLDKLGFKPAPQGLSLTQVNQRIEIVRAKDWRGSAGLDEGEEVIVEALPAECEPDHNGKPSQRQGPAEKDHADDPSP